MPVRKRKNRTPPGTRIGTHKDKTKTRLEHRRRDRRVQSALQEAQDEQRALEARMQAEEAKAQALDRQRLGFREDSVGARRAQEMAELAENIRRRSLWPLADARQLVRVGYSLESTVQRTGWPAAMLDDVRPGQW